MQSANRTRPKKVAVIGYVTILGGLLIMLGALLILLADYLGGEFPIYESDGKKLTLSVESTIKIIENVITISLAVAGVIIGYAFLKGRKWSWAVREHLSTANIIAGIYSVYSGEGVFNGIFFIIVNVVILYFLFKQDVKVYFGKVPKPANVT